jgi:hypothetical protein
LFLLILFSSLLYNFHVNESTEEEFLLIRERDLSTRELLSEITRHPRDGVLHGGLYDPAVVRYIGEKPYHFEYWFRGLESRQDGPSTYTVDPETDVVVFEQWKRMGELHRPKSEGYAIIHRDRITGKVTHGEYHESDNPLFRKQKNYNDSGPKLG